jgi:hypothetical protein
MVIVVERGNKLSEGLEPSDEDTQKGKVFSVQGHVYKHTKAFLGGGHIRIGAL